MRAPLAKSSALRRSQRSASGSLGTRLALSGPSSYTGSTEAMLPRAAEEAADEPTEEGPTACAR